MRTVGETGLVADIIGTADTEHEEHGVKCVALRTDMDALPMEEKTGLSYSSETSYAHMCGHDGHMAIMMATAEFLAAKRNRIPKNKKIRLIWQPAEETLQGAKRMIEDGCLEGVDEIYAIHNMPNSFVG